MTENLRQSVGNSAMRSLAQGWRHLLQSAARSLTVFRHGGQSSPPETNPEAHRWAVLGGELFEDDTRVVVRLEVPGMHKHDLRIEVREDTLLVSGEKHFEQEDTQGFWRVTERAYGSFNRAVPLPVEVLAGRATASYKDGVLRVELPKAHPGKLRRLTVPVH